MRKALLMLPVLAVMFGLMGQNAQAQVTGGPWTPGITMIEMSNVTGCDYIIQVYYQVGATWGMYQTPVIPAGGTHVGYYNHLTTTVQFVEAYNITSGGAAGLANPGYPGVTNSGLFPSGCTGGENVYWENFGFMGPGHVTNLIMFP